MEKESLKFYVGNLVKLHTDLEKQMLKFDEILPYERQTTAKIFSPRLLNMMLACCPQVESLTRLIAERANIKTENNSVPSLIHKINEKGVLSKFEIITKLHNLMFTPFTLHLEWWERYNALKHGLATNQSQINYTVVLDAFASLAGLHCLAKTIFSVYDVSIEKVLDQKHWLVPITIRNRFGRDMRPATWESLLFKIDHYFENY